MIQRIYIFLFLVNKSVIWWRRLVYNTIMMNLVCIYCTFSKEKNRSIKVFEVESTAPAASLLSWSQAWWCGSSTGGKKWWNESGVAINAIFPYYILPKEKWLVKHLITIFCPFIWYDPFYLGTLNRKNCQWPYLEWGSKQSSNRRR